MSAEQKKKISPPSILYAYIHETEKKFCDKRLITREALDSNAFDFFHVAEKFFLFLQFFWLPEDFFLEKQSCFSAA